MPTKRNTNKSNRGRRSRSTKKETPTKWSSVHELAHMVDGIIRHTAEALLTIKENPNYGKQIIVVHGALLGELTTAIVSIKQGVADAVHGMPTDPDTAVSEDEYPSYLERFVQLNGLHDRLLEEVVPGLGKISLAVIDLTEKDVHNDD